MHRTLTLQPIPDAKPGSVYYPLHLTRHHPHPSPGPAPANNQVLIRMHAAALNHRDLFIRQGLYPGLSLTSPLLADGVGTVVAVGDACTPATHALLHKRVLPTPCRGDPDAPPTPAGAASAFSACGSSKLYPDSGTARDVALVPETELEPCPPHLTNAEAAALPLTGLTAWRALVGKLGHGDAAALQGLNVLVTGIGGGVALSALQLGRALGCAVFVTSGSEAKIRRAVDELGAEAGVSYRRDGWERELAALLPAARPWLDGVIDGAGGDVVVRTTRLLRSAGVVVSYGMTTGPRMDWPMQAVLKNVALKGSTMGSRGEFRDMVGFVGEKGVRPVVSQVVKGLGNLEGIEGLFEEMKMGRQFGKLVVEIEDGENGKDGERL